MSFSSIYQKKLDEQNDINTLNELVGGTQNSQEIQGSEPPQVSFNNVGDLYDKFVSPFQSSEKDYQDQLKSFETRQRVNAAANAIKILASGVASGAFGGSGGMLVDKQEPDRWTPYLTNEIQKQKELISQEQRNALLAKQKSELDKFNLYLKYKDKDQARADQLYDIKNEQDFRTNLEKQRFENDRALQQDRQAGNEKVTEMDFENRKKLAGYESQLKQNEIAAQGNKELEVLKVKYGYGSGNENVNNSPTFSMKGTDGSEYTVSQGDILEFSNKILADNLEKPQDQRDIGLSMISLNPNDIDWIGRKALAQKYLEENYNIVNGVPVKKGFWDDITPNNQQPDTDFWGQPIKKVQEAADK